MILDLKFEGVSLDRAGYISSILRIKTMAGMGIATIPSDLWVATSPSTRSDKLKVSVGTELGRGSSLHQK